MKCETPHIETQGAKNCLTGQAHFAQNPPQCQTFCKDCSHFKCTEIDNGKILRIECRLFEKHAEPYDPACLFFNANFELACNDCVYLRVIPRPRKDKVFCWLDGEKAIVTQRACHNFSEVMGYE